MSKPRSPWTKTTTIAITVFLLLFMWMLSTEAKAETIVEGTYGATFVGGERYDSETVIFSESFNDKKIHAGLLLQLRLDCIEGSECKRGEREKANQAIFVQRVATYNNFKIGLGISYWHEQTPAWNSHTPYLLSMSYQFNNGVLVGWKHFSTGGSSTSNGGMDMLAVGYRF